MRRAREGMLSIHLWEKYSRRFELPCGVQAMIWKSRIVLKWWQDKGETESLQPAKG